MTSFPISFFLAMTTSIYSCEYTPIYKGWQRDEHGQTAKLEWTWAWWKMSNMMETNKMIFSPFSIKKRDENDPMKIDGRRSFHSTGFMKHLILWRFRIQIFFSFGTIDQARINETESDWSRTLWVHLKWCVNIKSSSKNSTTLGQKVEFVIFAWFTSIHFGQSKVSDIKIPILFYTIY